MIVKTYSRNKYSDLSFPICKLTKDNQQHLLECPELVIRRNIVVNNDPKYSDIFLDGIMMQRAALESFKLFYYYHGKIFWGQIFGLKLG